MSTQTGDGEIFTFQTKNGRKNVCMAWTNCQKCGAPVYSIAKKFCFDCIYRNKLLSARARARYNSKKGKRVVKRNTT